MQNVSLWFGYLMVIAVLSGAAVFTFTGFMSEELSGARRYGFIFILFIYGVYRIMRIRQILKHTKHDE